MNSLDLIKFTPFKVTTVFLVDILAIEFKSSSVSTSKESDFSSLSASLIKRLIF